MPWTAPSGKRCQRPLAFLAVTWGILRFTLSTGVVEFQLVSGSQLPLFFELPELAASVENKAG